jgi:hypothetical protein
MLFCFHQELQCAYSFAARSASNTNGTSDDSRIVTGNYLRSESTIDRYGIQLPLHIAAGQSKLDGVESAPVSMAGWNGADNRARSAMFSRRTKLVWQRRRSLDPCFSHP